jgi:hypothetical protein
MSMHGSCRCRNIEVHWRTVDFSVVPRACQCDYCRSQGAAYVSKAGTSVDVQVRDASLHRVVRHGSQRAAFHECASCGDLVLVTATFDGEMYGALNARCLRNKLEFASATGVDYSDHTAEQRQQRWRQNWCAPVLIHYCSGTPGPN